MKYKITCEMINPAVQVGSMLVPSIEETHIVKALKSLNWNWKINLVNIKIKTPHIAQKNNGKS